MTGWMTERRAAQREAFVEMQRQQTAERYAAYADVLPEGEWLTVRQCARLWWPERYKGLNTSENRKKRFACEASTIHRIRRMVKAGLLEAEDRPHPTRAQSCLHVRRLE